VDAEIDVKKECAAVGTYNYQDVKREDDKLFSGVDHGISLWVGHIFNSINLRAVTARDKALKDKEMNNSTLDAEGKRFLYPYDSKRTVTCKAPR
jgi:hypothetical protein